MATSSLGRFGLPGIADVHIIADSDGGAPFEYWKDLCHGNRNNLHTSIATAHNMLTTGRNDVCLLSPDNHTISSGITWSKNMSHLIGMYPESRMNQRSRITHDTAMASMLTVSGYGNLFANLYFAYGTGSATNLNLLTVSGDRNNFHNCHFLCSNATELDTSGFDLIRLNCGEGYFKNCFFGADTVATGATDMIRIYGGSDRACRVIFENCIFMMKADAGGDANFIETVSGNGSSVVMFLNCQFINIGTALTVAIDGTGLGNQKLYFDNRCSFIGCTDITTSGPDASVLTGQNDAGSAATTNLIGSFADNS
jgi:hypothetical protein